MSAVGDQAMLGVSPVVPCLSDDCAWGSLRELDSTVVIHVDRPCAARSDGLCRVFVVGPLHRGCRWPSVDVCVYSIT
jgi:hypothetical protein